MSVNLNAPLLGTYNLTDVHDGLIIGQDSGISKFSIVCTSATAIQMKGTRRAVLPLEGGGTVALTSEFIDILENESFGWSKDAGLSEIVIQIPSGATAKLSVL